MRVALYYPWVYLTSGAERSILELTGRSRHEWTIFTNRFEPDHTFPGFAQRNVVELNPVPVKRTIISAVSGALRIVTQRLPLDGFDALVVVCEGFGDLVLFRNSRVPAICLCLTPLRLAFDPVYRKRCLEEKSLWSRALISCGSSMFRVADRFAWKRYRRIVAISAEAKSRVAAGALAPEAAIDVVHPGLGFEPERPSTRFEPFFLLPGRIMWTKNIELGIQAFLRFQARNPQFQHFSLKIAGIVDRKSEPYFAKLKAMAGDAPVEFLRHPSDQELSELYQSCYATLFTAFNEDWGIVPIESMAYGKPVVAVNRGGPRESVIPGITGFLAEPDAESFSTAMLRLAADPAFCTRMGQAGHEHAKKYSWTSFTSHMDGVIESLVPRAAMMPVTQVAQRARRLDDRMLPDAEYKP